MNGRKLRRKKNTSSTNGERYVNALTKLPLFASNNDNWIYDDKERIVDAKDQAKALDRGWTQADGADVGWWQKHGGPNQKFTFVLV